MKLLLILYLLACLINVSAQNRWLKLNGPQGGFATALSAYGDTLLVGVGGDKGQLFYSFDKGNYWNSSIKLNQRITDFVIADDHTLIFNAGKLGIFKTSDFKTYSSLYSNGQYFVCLVKDKSGVIYAGTDGGNIYSSANNGLNWAFSLSNNTGYYINNFAQLSDSTILASTDDYIFSKKPGDNWNAIHVDTLFDCHLSTDTLDNIYVFNSGSMKMSTDKGATWINRDQLEFMHGNYMYSCIYNKRLIVACGDETGWFGDGWGMAISDDQGLTWRWNNNGMPPKFSSAYRLVKSGNDNYVGINAAGVFISTNFGDSWFPVNNGINAANTVSINLDNEGNLWAACWSNGLYKSTDKGLTWSLKNNGFTNSYLMSVISDTTDILIASTEDGTFRSSDKGENWGLLNSSFYYDFYKDKLNRIYGLSYGAGLYRTTDQGNNWTRLDNGFINGYVFGFAIDSSNNIYTGTYGGAIYKSTDDGTSWTNVYQSSNSSSGISCIAIAPNGNVFAANIDEGILRSTDNGLNWKLVKSDNGFPTTYPVNVNKKGVVFAGGVNSKFYSSTNNGDTWVDITDNLALTEVRDIKFDKDDNIYLATDESVWTSSPDSSVSVKDNSPIIQQYSLSQNFPNPFNPTTTIKYSIKDPGFVKLEVYDILGRKVETLVNEEKVEGDYEVNFNGKNLSSGVYIYRLTSGTFSQVKKMQLIK